MLILTRKQGEKILIGDAVEVVLVRVMGRQVQLGVKAPTGVPIYREELYRAIQQENLRAAQPSEERLKSLAAAVSQRR